MYKPPDTYVDFLEAMATGRRVPLFPDVLEPDPRGVVFVGGEMTVENVLEGYTRGCFPWTGEHPIPWYSPNPRLVLFPHRFRASRSLRRLYREDRYRLGFDQRFGAVLEYCASISRPNQEGTWITDNIKETYQALHHMNIAHSVEVYRGDELVGGLYGLTLGRAFFGESMFHLQPDTSKLALYHLCQALAARDFLFIDCQQVTRHLMSLGAMPIWRHDYQKCLRRALRHPSHHRSWSDWSPKKDI